MGGDVKRILLLTAVLFVPSTVFAQGSITGTVKDPSGAVLPGVTVEAASDVLIEKSRSSITDSAGLYRIVDLRPGTYTLTFTLPGFSTVKREGIELTGSATLTIPVELKVGALEETVTVTGDSPVVDVQNTRRETVIGADAISALPATRAYGSLLNAMPGVTVDNNGLAATPTMTFFSAHGGRTNEGRMAINGMTVAAAFNGGGVSSLTYDTGSGILPGMVLTDSGRYLPPYQTGWPGAQGLFFLPPTGTGVRVSVPFRLPAAAFALPPGLWLGVRLWRARRGLTRRRRARAGRCADCGYDLRASPEEGGALLCRCPECGRPAAALAA